MPIRKVQPSPSGDEYTPKNAEETTLWEDENPDEQAKESSSLQGGWGALKGAMENRTKPRSSGSGGMFRFSEDPKPILFLSDGPVSVYERHWVTREGRNSFKCLGSFGPVPCPLCAVGNRATLRADFQVLDLEFNGDEIVENPRIMSLGVTAAEHLAALNEDSRKGPLQGKWYAVYMTGTRPKVTHHFEAIKERDLEEDWGIPLDGAKQFAEEYVGKVEYRNFEPDLAELQEVAAEIKKAV